MPSLRSGPGSTLKRFSGDSRESPSSGKKELGLKQFQDCSKISHRSASSSQPRKSTISVRYIFSEGLRRQLEDLEDLENQEEIRFLDKLRLTLAGVIMGQKFEMSVGMVVILNFVVIVWETDMRAAGIDPDEMGVVNVVNALFMVFYVLEVVARLFVQRWAFFKCYWNLFDLSIVLAGLSNAALDAFVQVSGMQDMSVLRTIRMTRLLRASRLLVSFQELYALIGGLVHALKTLMWAAVLVFLVLTMWAVVAVEYINPLMPEVAEHGAYATCTWCPNAFSSIFEANLTWFQIISGDGWSTLARPIITHHPWTCLIFVAVIFMVIFGLLNLIIAVIVDSATQARESDVMNFAMRKGQEKEQAWACLSRLVEKIDNDQNGEISLEEVQGGIDMIPELAAYLTIMGIEVDDLEIVFQLLDTNGEGVVSCDAFARQLYKMKTQELPGMLGSIKHQILHIRKVLRILEERTRSEAFGKMEAMHPTPGNADEVVSPTWPSQTAHLEVKSALDDWTVEARAGDQGCEPRPGSGTGSVGGVAILAEESSFDKSGGQCGGVDCKSEVYVRTDRQATLTVTWNSMTSENSVTVLSERASTGCDHAPVSIGTNKKNEMDCILLPSSPSVHDLLQSGAVTKNTVECILFPSDTPASGHLRSPPLEDVISMKLKDGGPYSRAGPHGGKFSTQL